MRLKTVNNTLSNAIKKLTRGFWGGDNGLPCYPNGSTAELYNHINIIIQ